eukprot:9208958-Lingulodinium_polyedra.AAC.1
MYAALESRIQEQKQSRLSAMRGLLRGLTSTGHVPDISQKVLDIKAKIEMFKESEKPSLTAMMLI